MVWTQGYRSRTSDQLHAPCVVIAKALSLVRLFRDARLGRMHPANSFPTHESVAKTALGINPDGQPRWG
jgi:hypothetical protein